MFRIFFFIFLSINCVSFKIYHKPSMDCRREKNELDQGLGFKFISDFQPTSENRNLDQYIQQTSKVSDPRCDSISLVESYQYVTNSLESFQANQFLSLLQNKSIAILGDNFVGDLFHAIDTELSPYLNVERSMSPGNGTHQSIFDLKQRTKLKAEYRYYDRTNTQFLWCKDSKVLAINEDSMSVMNDFCRRQAFTSDILILSLGAHFKPPSYTRSMEEYEKYLDLQARLLEAHLLSLRQHLFRLNGKRQLVLWRLNAHAGGIDEYNAMYSNPLSLKNPHPNIHFLSPENRPSHHYEHNSLPLWDDLTLREASWVTRFNRVVRVVSDLHKDYVLDHYSISMDLLKKERDRIEKIKYQIEISTSSSSSSSSTSATPSSPSSIDLSLLSIRSLRSSSSPSIDFLRSLNSYFSPITSLPILPNPNLNLNPNPIPIHSDSMHYCAGGLFRAAVLQLYKVIEHAHYCDGF